VSDAVTNPFKKRISSPRGGELLTHYATASTAYQILNPDMSHWIHAETLFGFKKAFGWTIVAGEPVGPMMEQSRMMHAFESEHGPVAYFAAERDFQLRHAATHPYAVYLGSQPVWTSADWVLSVRHASLRYQCNRVKNKGVVLSAVAASEVMTAPEYRQLRKDWLTHHGLPPLHFLVESDIFDDPGDRRFFCAHLNGRLLGMLVLAPISQRHGYLVELSLRHPEAPNGTIEYLLDYVFRSVSGIQMLTLGLSPLRPSSWQNKSPFWVRGIFALMRRFGSPFYDFAGLNRFKEKCRPGSWEPLFLMSRHPITPRTLAAVAKVFLK